MCRSRTKVSWRDILNLGFGQRPIAEVTAEKARRVKVDLAAKNLAQFLFHPEEGETRSLTGFKLHYDVHVTVRPKIVA